MPLFDSGGELSLRHLPDDSDASFSFQIPGIAPTENLLANNNDMEFFQDADLSDTIAQPLLSPPARATSAVLSDPLTLSQLTPRPEKLRVTRNSTKSLLPYPSFPSNFKPDENAKPQQEMPQPSKRPRVQRPELKLNIKGVVHTSPNIVAQTQPAQAVAVEDIAAEESVPVRHESSVLPFPTAGDSVKPTGIRRRSIEKKEFTKRELGREAHNLRSKQKVIEGGITKTRNAKTNITKSNAAPRHVPQAVVAAPSPQRVSSTSALPEEIHVENPSFADTSGASLLSGGGVAERLLQYSQKFMNPFALFTPETSLEVPTQSPITTDTVITQPVPSEQKSPMLKDVEEGDDEDEDDKEKPLTLSQLSPRKVSSTYQENTLALKANPPVDPLPPASPMRPSRKRVVSTMASDVAQKRVHKKSKSEFTGSAVGSGSGRPPLPVVVHNPSEKQKQKPRAVSGSASASGSRSRPVDARKPARRIVSGPGGRVASVSKPTQALPAFKPGGSWNDDVRLPGAELTTSNPLIPPSSSSLGKPTVINTEARLVTSGGAKGKEKATNPTTDLQARSLSRTSANSRSHSRSQSQSEHRLRVYHPVPDFAALHASNSASLAQIKENLALHPTVPIPIHWSTEERAEERRKFDAKVREKEEEMKNQEEKRRREREVQEEMEIREARKKAVVKAHEVPEWYAGMPKRERKEDALEGR